MIEGTTHRNQGFSLVELLVVIAVVGILATLSIPAFSSIQRASGINRGGQLLADALIAARQEASSRNRDVEVRLIVSGEPPAYRAFQTWVAGDDGVMSPLSKVDILPASTLIAADGQLSPILDANPDLAGTAEFASLGNCEFVAIRMRAGGLPDPAIIKSNNFLTVHVATDTGIPPDNYFTIRLEPATGRINTYRP